jgi:diguanylate cyclase (GGDEF)-like protein
MNRSFVRIGLAGRLLIAAFVPAQAPFVAYVISGRYHLDRSGTSEAVVLASLLAIGLSAFLIDSIVTPIRRARHRLHEIADAHHLVPPGTSAVTDDEALLGSLNRSMEELTEAGTLDPLTGTGNRRVCQQRLRDDIARSKRHGLDLSFAFFDLDQLKEVNDRFGHPAGDRCLLHLVDTIRRNVREGDWIARWGGDEFVLMLWNANEAQAREICDRVLAAVRNNPVEDEGRFIGITASVGIAQAAPGQDADSLLHNADVALLRSKRDGKDRSSVFKWI